MIMNHDHHNTLLTLLRHHFMFAIFAPSQVGIPIGYIGDFMKIIMILIT